MQRNQSPQMGTRPVDEPVSRWKAEQISVARVAASNVGDRSTGNENKQIWLTSLDCVPQFVGQGFDWMISQLIAMNCQFDTVCGQGRVKFGERHSVPQFFVSM